MAEARKSKLSVCECGRNYKPNELEACSVCVRKFKYALCPKCGKRYSQNAWKMCVICISKHKPRRQSNPFKPAPKPKRKPASDALYKLDKRYRNPGRPRKF